MIKTKKLMVSFILLVFIVVGCSPNTKPLNSQSSQEEIEIDTQNNDLDETEMELNVNKNVSREKEVRYQFLLDHKKEGGPPPDGIPPIEKPDYISVEEASPNMEALEKVFVLELNNEVYIYPQRVLVWHEIVNLIDQDVALTYCPLTGSAITYKYPQDSETTFGTSGSLINSNLLMYDRHSDTYISQIDGIGLDKDLKGLELETLPTYWMDWQDARKTFPKAKVLSRETGFIRDYKSDPYGSYVKEFSGNYYEESSLIFPPLNEDEKKLFHEKYSVIGVKSGDERLAIDPSYVEAKGIVRFELNDKSYISFYDDHISNIRIYEDNRNLTVNLKENKISSEDGIDYKLNGQSESKGSLTSPIHFEVMWFAWYGFYPDTEVIYE